jgi:exodeoxyribonuclease V beta subunit
MNIFKPFEVGLSGLNLIEASAGTGKTYNIASLYIRAIIENRPISEILVVTYTNAAAKELRERLMRRIRDAIRALNGADVEDDTFLKGLQSKTSNKKAAIQKLKSAAHHFDEASVYTIHGFCQQVLQEYAFESGAPFQAELIGNDEEIVQELVDDYWRSWIQKYSNSPIGHAFIDHILEKKYNPEKLTKVFGGYVGKPYLKIQPDSWFGEQDVDQQLNQLKNVFHELQSLWQEQSDEIYSLLRCEQINGSKYRKDHLSNWMSQMGDFLNDEISSIEPFERFGKFCQTTVNNSLKKTAQKPPPQHLFFEKADIYMAQVHALEPLFKVDLFNYLLPKIDKKKEELQAYSYDDLLIRLQNALSHPQVGTKLRERLSRAYPIALVDEFQDTDPVQYDIFRTVYAGNEETALFMIGDPKQSIYSFRGADVFVYLQARKETLVENRYDLEFNYRSAEPLLDAFNAFFGRFANPFLLDSISYQPVRAGKKDINCLQTEHSAYEPFEIRYLAKPEDDKPLTKKKAKDFTAEDTAVQIKKMLFDAQNGQAKIGEQPLHAKDIAVLVRNHKQADLVKKELKEQGIHCIIHSKSNVYKSEEARQLYIVLNAVANPSDESLVTAALATALFCYNGKELLELKENGIEWAAKLEQFYQWHRLWQKRNFSFFFRTMMQEEKIAEILMKRSDGERMLTNINHLAGLLRYEEKQSGNEMHSLLKWMLKKRNEEENEIDEEQLRLESDENLVQVITQHHSKGLEYPVVFCPFLWYAKQLKDQGEPVTYHDPADHNRAVLDLNGKNDPDREKKKFMQAREALEEGLRLAYVALTRAKQKCIVHWVEAKEAKVSPLGYLLSGEEQTIAELKAACFKGSKGESNHSGKYRESIDKLGEHSSIRVEALDRINHELDDITFGNSQQKLKAKTFQRAVPLSGGKGLSSFSSLTRGNAQVERESFEYYDEFMEREHEPKFTASNIFGFPKGAAPGTAIHHILEYINFSNEEQWDEVILKYLEQENIEDRWLPVVQRMLRRTVHKSLLSSNPSLKLAAIPQNQMVQEMRFHFTNRNIELADLLAVIRSGPFKDEIPDCFADEGFLTGFIDLTFCSNGKYYILDYKTNYLGDQTEDYNEKGLNEAMKDHFYYLQYHLYLIALHRFLKYKIPAYDYRKHVGGALYLFVRGINEENDAGIYFDLPEAALIHKLDDYLNPDYSQK